MPNGKPESRLIKAAGAVAWRPGPGGEPEILLVHRKRYDDWSLPKGKIEPGETLPVTAAREVLEEGGARLALGRRLVSIRYQVGGRPKRVHYWAARVTSMDEHAVPNAEVDLIEWVPAGQATGRVSYAHDHGVLADFARLPAHTVPLIVLRHARAAGKSDWNRGDATRPLDDSGRAEAQALAVLLACFAPGAGFAPRVRLVSSPAARCLETLRPFAELTGLQLREEPSLYIHNQSSGTSRADSVPSMAAVIRAAIESGEPTVLCAHRENIPDLQSAALAALRAVSGSGSGDDGPVSHTLPEDWDAPLPTAGFWVLNLAHSPAPQLPPSPPPSRPPSSGSPPAAPGSASAESASAGGPSVWPALRRLLPFPGRDRFRRPGDRTRPTAAADVRLSAEAAARPGVGAAAPKAADGSRPAPVLISADRYDLSPS